MDSLELRRSVTRRETEVYLMGLLYLVVSVVAGWWTVDFWVDSVPELVEGPSYGSLVLVAGGLVMAGLLALLLWWGTPMWQLALRPGRREDVVVTLDREGLVLRDAGFTLAVPWTSMSAVRMEPRAAGTESLVPVVSGPVVRSRGRLPALVEKGMRRGVFRMRLEAEDPTPDEVRAGIRLLSGGAVEVT
jgi:hypothetical protein